ncbi:putative RNA methyltransferase C2A9.10 [Schizosaccharomyces pombe]
MRGGTSIIDPRLKCLPDSLFYEASVLDIGCNNGTVSAQIASIFGASFVLGLDIDHVLIQKARKHLEFVSSRIGPVRNPGSIVEDQFNYYPISSIKKFSRIPVQLQPPLNKQNFPHNIEFETADFLRWESKRKFKIILALSVSKWVHLNNHDEGIIKFFGKISSLLETNGVLILEPQGWDSYLKAAKKISVFNQTPENLKIQPDAFEHLLNQAGLVLEYSIEPQVNNSEYKNFAKRTMYIYKKKGIGIIKLLTST